MFAGAFSVVWVMISLQTIVIGCQCATIASSFHRFYQPVVRLALHRVNSPILDYRLFCLPSAILDYWLSLSLLEGTNESPYFVQYLFRGNSPFVGGGALPPF